MKKFCSLSMMLVAAFAMGACDDSPTGTEPGQMTLLLTDAPGDFATAIVTIERIELLRDDEAADDSSDDAEDNRIVLMDQAWTGDLLELSNDVDSLVSEITIPGGSYSQLRFIISGGCIAVENEDSSTSVYASNGYTECGAADGNLQMPSLASSGLKVNLPAGFSVDGDHRIVLLDFDVSESFGHVAGNSGNWVMHPVIHASEIVMSGNLDVSVVVADSVELPRELTADSFMVQIDDEPAVAVVNGVAGFDFLLPGTYSVDLVTPDSVTVTTDPSLPLSIEIGSSDDETATITITSAL
jgi:hypothetical protein